MRCTPIFWTQRERDLDPNSPSVSWYTWFLHLPYCRCTDVLYYLTRATFHSHEGSLLNLECFLLLFCLPLSHPLYLLEHRKGKKGAKQILCIFLVHPCFYLVTFQRWLLSLSINAKNFKHIFFHSANFTSIGIFFISCQKVFPPLQLLLTCHKSEKRVIVFISPSTTPSWIILLYFHLWL